MDLPPRPRLLDHIEHSRVLGAFGSFVPKSSLKFYLTKERIRDLLKDFNQDTAEDSNIIENYLNIFTILVVLDKVGYISHFIKRDYLTDKQLPFRNSNDWPTGCTHFFDEFYHAQWQYCVRNLDTNRLNGLKLHEDEVIPITKINVLNKGSNSITHKIEVHSDYNELSKESNVFLLKGCCADGMSLHENEVNAYRLLMQEPHVEPNMVKFYGSYRHLGRFNILLEYVNGGTLEEFFQREQPPSSHQERLHFWSSLFEILKPMIRIRELKHPHKAIILQGIHQDIKPANILISPRNEKSSYDFVCKLADFGLMQFEQKPKLGQDVDGTDGCGTQMYSAPECLRGDSFLQRCILPINTSIDIWSLGAVFSEAVVWSVLGTKGLEDYSDRRCIGTSRNQELRNAGYSGCFHDGNVVLKEVQNMHIYVRDRCHQTDTITKAMSDLAGVMMDEPAARPKPHEIYKRYKDILRVASDPSVLEAKTQTQLPTLKQDNPVPLIFQTKNTRRTPLALPATLDLGNTPIKNSSHNISHAEMTSFLLQEPDNRTHTQYGTSSGAESELSLLARGKSRHGDQIQCGRTSSPMDDHNHATHESPVVREEICPAPGPGEMQNHRPRSMHEQSTPMVPSGTMHTNKAKMPHITTKQVVQWRAQLTDVTFSPLEGLTRCLKRLKHREQKILIDDSLSMSDHWPEVIIAVKALVFSTITVDPDGIELSFTNSNACKRSNDVNELIDMVRNATPADQCDIKHRVSHVLESWWDDYVTGDDRRGSWNWLHQWSPPKKKHGLNLFILTDGLWQDGPSPICGLEKPIENIIGKLAKQGWDSSRVGIQLIRFGNHPLGTQRLDILDSGLDGYFGISTDIVDTEPSDGNVCKMLLGSIDKYWDDDDNHDTMRTSSADEPHFAHNKS